MNRYLFKIKQLFTWLMDGHLKALIRTIRQWIWSDTLYLGLLRDLSIPHKAPKAKIPLIVRPANEVDREKILAMNQQGILIRHRLLNENMGTCFVALSPEGDPCYLQWILTASENDDIQSFFGPGFLPWLDPDEVLLEGAFTPDKYRGLGIMPDALSQIAHKALDFQAKKAFCFVEAENIPALKGCKRAGFSPYMTRNIRFRMFFRKISFNLLPQGTPFSFD